MPVTCCGMRVGLLDCLTVYQRTEEGASLLRGRPFPCRDAQCLGSVQDPPDPNPTRLACREC